MQADGVVSASVERLRRNSPKIANTGQNDIHEAIKELIHAVAAQCHHCTDRHAFANLESCYGFLGTGDDWLLSGNLAEFIDRRIQDFRVLRSLANPHVDDDLVQMRNRPRVLELKLFHERRSHFLAEPVLQPWRFLRAMPRCLWRALFFRLRPALLFLFLFCHYSVHSHRLGCLPVREPNPKSYPASFRTFGRHALFDLRGPHAPHGSVRRWSKPAAPSKSRSGSLGRQCRLWSEDSALC